MNRLWQIAAVLAALPSVAAAATVQGEREELVSGPLPGYVEAYSQNEAGKSIAVEIPANQTPDAWSRKVTTQWFKGLADNLEPDEYATEIRSILAQTCPGAIASPVRSGRKNGFDSFSFRAICPSTDEGSRITFMLLGFAGKKDMFVKQVAFRGRATSQDFLWGMDFLQTVRLCKIDSDKKGCPGSRGDADKSKKKHGKGIKHLFDFL